MKAFTIDPARPEKRLLEEAASLVRAGELVAFPTETVYGIAANALDEKAVEKLNSVKGRPDGKPYSYHFGSLDDLFSFAGRLPESIERFFRAFCPGPVTVVYFDEKFKRKIGIRIPNHPVSRLFLSACAVPVFAPSANPSGEKSPVCAADVKRFFDKKLGALIDAGPCTFGKDSTVVEITESSYAILRPGAVEEKDIAAFFA